MQRSHGMHSRWAKNPGEQRYRTARIGCRCSEKVDGTARGSGECDDTVARCLSRLGPFSLLKRSRMPSGAATHSIQATAFTTYLTLVERWDGTAWTIQTSPNPDTVLNGLLGVACRTASECTGVGYTSSKALVERWNGTTWKVQPTLIPSSGQEPYLQKVACPAANACTAVGWYINVSFAEASLVEHWNGTSWTIEFIPSPGGAFDTLLVGVSCTTATACTAVGGYDTAPSGTLSPLAERSTAGGWSVQPTPTLAGFLDDVACVAASSCIAVGSQGTISAVTLAERWNGTAWIVQATPDPSPRDDAPFLRGVVCTGATDCTAVGDQSFVQSIFSGHYAG